MVHRGLLFVRARDCRSSEDIHPDTRLERLTYHRPPPLCAVHLLGRALANAGAHS